MRQLQVTLALALQVALFLGGTLGLPFSAALAESNFFAAQVPVTSQSPDDRSVALKAALAEVLVKVSGSLEMPTHSAGAEAIANATKYVQQFRYIQPSPAQRSTGTELLLSAEFDAGLIKNIIKRGGMGVWPVNRPQVLVWAIEDTLEGRQVITDPNHPVMAALLARADVRGLPTLLPLWDLDDQMLLNDEQLWAMNDEAIMAASSRYDATTVLTARYTQTSDGQWFASWQFNHAGERRVYDLRSPNFAGLAAAAVDPLVTYLAERYAVRSVTDEQEHLQRIHVHGVHSYAAYQNVLAYLSKQPLISHIKLMGVEGDQLTVQILLAASWSQLNNAFALDRKIKPLNEGLSAYQLSTLGAPDAPAQYQWQGQ